MPHNASYEYDDEYTFGTPSREHILERRVKDLEETVARLEKELHSVKASNYGITKVSDYQFGVKGTKANIGALAGTIGASLPQEPYKAD